MDQQVAYARSAVTRGVNFARSSLSAGDCATAQQAISAAWADNEAYKGVLSMHGQSQSPAIRLSQQITKVSGQVARACAGSEGYETPSGTSTDPYAHGSGGDALIPPSFHGALGAASLADNALVGSLGLLGVGALLGAILVLKGR